MRHLDRNGVPAPACLSNYSHFLHKWDDVGADDKCEIRDRLGDLQNTHCAYCECDLSREGQNPHIEHFEQRSRARQKTFEWENLFWSCSHEDHCGKRKDHKDVINTYAPQDLLKPDVDKPGEFLFFASDGKVWARGGLDAARTKRAKETIRVFGLNAGHLTGLRKVHLAAPRGQIEEAAQAGFSPEEFSEYLQDLEADYADKPFSAALHCLLEVSNRH